MKAATTPAPAPSEQNEINLIHDQDVLLGSPISLRSGRRTCLCLFFRFPAYAEEAILVASRCSPVCGTIPIHHVSTRI